MVKKKDEIPEWVSDEIQNAKFKKPEELKRTGYILEIIVPSVVRGAVWMKTTFPYLINPLLGSAFSKQLNKKEQN